ncbi:MAG: 2-C-methyl-D-erythritol 4-phosphate cytidylyltransferase, partial [Bacillota bacterium]
MSSLGVILPAAGRSVRYGGDRNKLLELLDGRPVIAHAASAFLSRPDVKMLVVVTADQSTIAQALPQPLDPRIVFCRGGASRAESVRNGLAAIGPAIEWVAVHDAARPLVSQKLIDRTLSVASEHGAAVPAMPVHLTIKQARGPLPAAVERTIPRDTLWAMQTPQIMRRDALAGAFERCPLPLSAVTDDVQLLELTGQPVWLAEGEERNLKITTRLDLRIAELL